MLRIRRSLHVKYRWYLVDVEWQHGYWLIWWRTSLLRISQFAIIGGKHSRVLPVSEYPVFCYLYAGESYEKTTLEQDETPPTDPLAEYKALTWGFFLPLKMPSTTIRMKPGVTLKDRHANLECVTPVRMFNVTSFGTRERRAPWNFADWLLGYLTSAHQQRGMAIYQYQKASSWEFCRSTAYILRADNITRRDGLTPISQARTCGYRHKWPSSTLTTAPHVEGVTC